MSKLPYELFLALRYFRPKGTYVSVITLIAIIGVMFAVGTLIVVISVMSGFDRELRNKILGFNAHLKVYHAGGPMIKYRALMTNVSSHAQVTGVTPFVMGQVLVETKAQGGRNPMVAAPYIRGVDILTEGQVSVLPKSIKKGQYNLEGRNLLVGCELAANLGLSVGDPVTVYSVPDLQKMRQNLEKKTEQAILAPEYTVAGIFDVGHFEYNISIIATSLENAQSLYKLDDDDAIHGLMVMIQDPFHAHQVRQELEQSLGYRYRITTWLEENSGILTALAVEKQAMFVVLFVVMIVAAFGIMGTQIAFVFQKTREIGILKALGSTHRQIAWLFLSQSVMVGVIGVLAGLGFGLTLLSWRNEFLRFMNRATGLDLFPASIYVFNDLPALTMPGDVIAICGSAMVLCVLAGVLPAIRAASLHPVEALRYE